MNLRVLSGTKKKFLGKSNGIRSTGRRTVGGQH